MIRVTNEEAPKRIIQIVSHAAQLYGLDIDGNVWFLFHGVDPNSAKPKTEWVLSMPGPFWNTNDIVEIDRV